MSKLNNRYPSKTEYENALKVVQEYEQRQDTLKRLANDLSYHLSKFETVKFKVDKKEGRVLFTGVLDGKIKIGESVCSSSDVFNDTIGKLVSVKKALGLDVEDVFEHVECRGILFKSSAINVNDYFLKISEQGIVAKW